MACSAGFDKRPTPGDVAPRGSGRAVMDPPRVAQGPRDEGTEIYLRSPCSDLVASVMEDDPPPRHASVRPPTCCAISMEAKAITQGAS